MGDASGETNHRSGRGFEYLVPVQDPRRSFHEEDVLVLLLVKMNRGAVSRS